MKYLNISESRQNNNIKDVAGNPKFAEDDPDLHSKEKFKKISKITQTDI